MGSVEELQEEIRTLKADLAKSEKIRSVLVERVERSIESAGSAYTLFENNILLQQKVQQRTEELQRTNKDLLKEIAERKKAEETLKESEETLRALIDATQETLLMIDTSGTVLVANEVVARRLGKDLSDLVGTHVYDHFPPDTAKTRRGQYERVAATGMTIRFTDTARGRIFDQFVYPVFDEGGSVSRIVIFAHDITERIEAQEEKTHLESQLRQSQKMEAIGTLAGGVAHDFNNILTTIIGYASLLKMSMEDDGRKCYVDEILESSQKAAILTRSLLAFSRKQVIALKPRRIAAIVKEAEKLLRRLLTEDIEFTVIPSESDITVEADITQMGQVLMNLATNARDAMPEGGRFTITTKAVTLDEDFAAVQGFGEPGECYACLSVADTGIGMDQETQQKIFEPFFTTKEVGKGTGLGLSLVYGIIKQHNGAVTVLSQPGRGTRFDIYLPIVNTGAVETKETPEYVRGGNETILVAEDNSDVRRLTKDILTSRGYTVIEAGDGDEALRQFEEHKDEIALLLLDVVMPRKNGREVYEEVRRTRPDVKTVFASGYTADVVLVKGVRDDAINYISKPLTPYQLLRKVREVLDTKTV